MIRGKSTRGLAPANSDDNPIRKGRPSELHLQYSAFHTFFRKLLLRDHPLTVKLLVFSALIVVVPLSLVGLISYKQAELVLQKETRHYSWQIISQVQNYVEDYLRDFELSTIKIVNHPDTIAFLRMKTNEEIVRKDLLRGMRRVLIDASFSRPDIANVSIILNDGQMISSSEDATYNSLPSISTEHWYPSIPPLGEPMLFSRVIEWKARREPVISIAKLIVSPQTLEPFGLLLIDVNYSRLEDTAKNVQLGETGYLYILDERGHYVYHPAHDMIGMQINEEDFAAIVEQPAGSFISTSDRRNLLTYRYSSTLNWHIVTSIPYDELTRETHFIGKTILITVILALTCVYILGIGFAASIIRPLRKLHSYMKLVEIGDLSQKVEVTSKDEIGLLSHGFNKMVDKLSASLNEIYVSRLRETELSLRQKKTQLKVLQSQLNPHFLSNSLETIRGMALARDMEDIAQIAASLTKVLRYNLHNPLPTVTLKEEMDICSLYLKIQKFRFEQKLEYEWDVPEWAYQQKIAKFSLQPLIENCIEHGLEPSGHSTHIRISATVDADVLTVSIRDTGAGMSKQELDRVRMQLIEGRNLAENGKHIGLTNIHMRNQYLFGAKYGLHIDSQAGTGTTVCLTLPWMGNAARRMEVMNA